MPDVRGSAIEAASDAINKETAEQVAAIKALGGKMTGGKRQRGGAQVEVKNMPTYTTAGGANPSEVYANMMKLQADVNEQMKYDNLGGAPPMRVGGRRKRTRRHNAGSVRSHTRKHRRTHRRTRRVRHSRGRVHNVRR